ncbi:Maf family protein [Plantactinospora sonchi]|uniref:Nucleoside triphosphate pyrophosphatase n=1 Tax=Plantactinospora sonchi TaxID=1544735 RepID=A0ABU7RSY2_9ACTN
MGTTIRPRLVLASASPARRKLLQAAGIEPEVLVSGVDESQVDHSTPEALSLTLARLKARAVADRLDPSIAGSTSTETGTGTGSSSRETGSGSSRENGGSGGTENGQPRTLVLGCDSVLAFDGEILGKPADADEAVRRWRNMRGRSGVLHTGHSLVELTTGREVGRVAGTAVHFAEVTDDEIDAYVATGEPLHVAGAFTLDGLGGPFVERVEGDPGTVIGLSLPLLRGMLGEFGVRITDLWTVSPVRPGSR